MLYFCWLLLCTCWQGQQMWCSSPWCFPGGTYQHPQEEDNRGKLLTGLGWVALFYLHRSPKVHLPSKSWNHTNFWRAFMSVPRPPAKFDPEGFRVTFPKKNHFFPSAVFPAYRTDGSQLFWQLPSRWRQSSWWAVWLGCGLLIHLCTVGLALSIFMGPNRLSNIKRASSPIVLATGKWGTVP